MSLFLLVRDRARLHTSDALSRFFYAFHHLDILLLHFLKLPFHHLKAFILHIWLLKILQNLRASYSYKNTESEMELGICSSITASPHHLLFVGCCFCLEALLLSRLLLLIWPAASADPALGHIPVWRNTDLSGLDRSHNCGSACSLSGTLTGTRKDTHALFLSLRSPISAEFICLSLDCCNVTRPSPARDNKSLTCILFWEQVRRLLPPECVHCWIVFKYRSWDVKITCSQIRICNSQQSIIWIKKKIKSTANVYVSMTWVFSLLVTIATALSLKPPKAIRRCIVWAASCCLLFTVSLFTDHRFYLPMWSLWE